MPESGTTPAPRDRIAAIALSFLKPPTFSGGSWTLAPLDLADALISAFPVLAAEPTTAIPSDDDLLDVLFDADPNARLEVTTAGIRAVFDAGVRLAALAPEPAGVATHNTASEPTRGYHMADCAMNNEPAMPAGPCNCEHAELAHALVWHADNLSEDGLYEAIQRDLRLASSALRSLALLVPTSKETSDE